MVDGIQDLVFVVTGVTISIIGYFLKQKSARVTEMEDRLAIVEKELAQNTTRDCERWYWVNKTLEDRRLDVIKIYEKLNNKEK